MVEGKTQELEPKKEFTLKRELSVWIFRHGNWDYVNDKLSKKGRQEATEAGERLLEMIGEGEVVKFFISPTGRTQETAAIMQGVFEGKGKKIYSPRTREALMGPGFDQEYVEAAKKSGYATGDLLDYWYEVDDPRGKVKTPQQVQERLAGFLFRLGRVVSRLPEGSEKINLVLVSHGESAGTFLKQSFGEIGLPTCGWVRFDFDRGEVGKIKMITQDNKSSEINL